MKKQISKSMKAKWADPKFRRRMLTAQRKGRRRRSDAVESGVQFYVGGQFRGRWPVYNTKKRKHGGRSFRAERWFDVKAEALREASRLNDEVAGKEAKTLESASSTAKLSKMRRFVLERTRDLTGTSGTGIVAEGVQFSNGQVVIHWISQLEAINVYGNAVVLETLHGHGGGTVVRWLDK